MMLGRRGVRRPAPATRRPDTLSGGRPHPDPNTIPDGGDLPAGRPPWICCYPGTCRSVRARHLWRRRPYGARPPSTLMQFVSALPEVACMRPAGHPGGHPPDFKPVFPTFGTLRPRLMPWLPAAAPPIQPRRRPATTAIQAVISKMAGPRSHSSGPGLHEGRAKTRSATFCGFPIIFITPPLQTPC